MSRSLVMSLALVLMTLVLASCSSGNGAPTATPTPTEAATTGPTAEPTITPRTIPTGTPATVAPTGINGLPITRTATPIATPRPDPPRGFYQHATRVGISELDAVIAAVTNADASTVASMVEVSRTACTTHPPSPPDHVLPDCPEGVADGTLVLGIPVAGSCKDGRFLYGRAAIDEYVAYVLRTPFWLYSASTDEYSAQPGDESAYLLVFGNDVGAVPVLAVRVARSTGAITSFDAFTCGLTPRSFANARQPLLPPPPNP